MSCFGPNRQSFGCFLNCMHLTVTCNDDLLYHISDICIIYQVSDKDTSIITQIIVPLLLQGSHTNNGYVQVNNNHLTSFSEHIRFSLRDPELLVRESCAPILFFNLQARSNVTFDKYNFSKHCSSRSSWFLFWA